LRLAVLVLIDGEAGYQLVAVLLELRLELFAGAESAAAAGVERATGRWVQRAWQQQHCFQRQ